MYDVIDICRYMIVYCNIKNYAISNLKLQKLLYFIQAIFLCEEKRPCFDDEIEAWEFGPVVPRAYYEYRHCGGMSIFPDYISFDGYDENKISKKHRTHINIIIDEFSGFTASDLVEITHNQDPWIEAYQSVNNIITKESLEKYFNEEYR